MPTKIKVNYDGKCPSLCFGNLSVEIDGIEYHFPYHCLTSGGECYLNDEGNFEVNTGKWEVREWPKGFPEEHKTETLKVINDQIKWGCCGGCA